VIVDWKMKNGEVRHGCATDYLRRLGPGDKVVGKVTSGTFNFPADPRTPMVMAGLGTGLAPFRAFVQERAWLRRSQPGLVTGPMWLFYGCRYKAKDFIFGDELEKLLQLGALTELHPAFSRDQKTKVNHTRNGWRRCEKYTRNGWRRCEKYTRNGWRRCVNYT
jgi:sulfite reductase alpha subunit-like flavoprotein